MPDKLLLIPWAATNTYTIQLSIVSIQNDCYLGLLILTQMLTPELGRNNGHNRHFAVRGRRFLEPHARVYAGHSTRVAR
jgi:hypothetical protein